VSNIPYCTLAQALPLHLSCCVVLGKRSELFQLGHRLTEAHPSVAVAWFAVSEP
jgi:hypothetical protein